MSSLGTSGPVGGFVAKVPGVLSKIANQNISGWTGIWVNPVTSSPSPKHSPNKVHADQFHGYPAIDNNALSIASSRRDNRYRNSAFLEVSM